jgi:hypothetical protein
MFGTGHFSLKSFVDVDEYIVIPDEVKIPKSSSDEFHKYIRSNTTTAIVKLAPVISALSSHMFMQTGHHYKKEYDSKYDILMKGTLLSDYFEIIKLDKEELFRTTVHPFGVALPRKCYVDRSKVKALPANLIMRVNAAPAGSAMNVTAHSVLNAMKSTSFWNAFESAYKTEIVEVERISQDIKDHTEHYHVAANLLGFGSRTANVESAEKIAPFLQAFLNTMATGTRLARQKTLLKVANENAGSLREIEGLFDKYLRESDHDLVSYLKNLSD